MQKFDLDELNAKIKEESTFVEAIFDEISKVIIGQENIVNLLIKKLNSWLGRVYCLRKYYLMI